MLSTTDLEALIRTLDARYLPALTPRVRIAIVTAALNVGSYSIRLPGETGDRDQVPSVSPVAPLVGEGVRIELVGEPPSPVIVDRVPGRAMQQGTLSFTLAGGAGTFPSGTAVAAASGSVTFPVPYPVAPVVQLAQLIGANLDVGANLTSRSATGFGYRVFARDPGTSWNGAGGTLLWQATAA